MPKRADNLFERIATFPALWAAARRAIRGKRKKPGAARLQFGLERELLKLERELKTGSYQPGRYIKIELHEPKHRIVSAAPFRDRVVHHALMNVVAPIFERGFIANNYANQIGKGSHAAVRAYERYRDRYAYVLRCDIFRYFPAIDHAVLKGDLRRRIKCARTLALLDAIIDGSNAQEPVHLHFPGDDLFAPFDRRRGLPIGNLTSQCFANVYLDPLDHFCTEVLRVGGAKNGGAPYLRYVDDFALFHDDPAVLEDWRARITQFLVGRRLRLHPRKTEIVETGAPAAFLGYELSPGGRRRLPEANVRRFRGRLRAIKDRLMAGAIDPAEAGARIGAWVAHASHANTARLRRAIFRASGVIPPRKPGRPPARTASIAAAPGTTRHGTSAPRIATGTPRRTGTTI